MSDSAANEIAYRRTRLGNEKELYALTSISINEGVPVPNLWSPLPETDLTVQLWMTTLDTIFGSRQRLLQFVRSSVAAEQGVAGRLAA